MKKVRFVMFLLSCCMLLNLVPSVANAAEMVESKSIVYADPAEQLLPYQGIMPREPAGLEYLLFGMEANQLTSKLLTTNNSGKFFVKSQIPSDGYLFYVGRLTANKTHAAAGICYYSTSSGEFVSIHETDFPSNTATSSGYILPNNLRDNRAYLGYIKNVDVAGYVSGYVHYYYLDMD